MRGCDHWMRIFDRIAGELATREPASLTDEERGYLDVATRAVGRATEAVPVAVLALCGLTPGLTYARAAPQIRKRHGLRRPTDEPQRITSARKRACALAWGVRVPGLSSSR